MVSHLVSLWVWYKGHLKSCTSLQGTYLKVQEPDVLTDRYMTERQWAARSLASEQSLACLQASKQASKHASKQASKRASMSSSGCGTDTARGQAFMKHDA